MISSYCLSIPDAFDITPAVKCRSNKTPIQRKYEKGEELMGYIYKTKGTCSTLIEVELDGNVVKYVKFTGGCNGNLQAIPKLVEGLTIEQVEEKIGGISCNGRATSCGDQLAKACRAAYEAAQN